jgi:uncharacterized protein YqhQ
MNWETFKQLSKEEREEYQYKYGDGPETNSWYIVTALIGVGLVYFHLFLFYVIAISTNETLLQYRDIIGSVVSQDLKVILVVMWIIVISMFYNGVMSIIYGVGRKRWLKKHNIKLGWRDVWK